MKEKMQVWIGDKVTLESAEGVTYTTMLEDITPKGLLRVSSPTYRGIPAALHNGERLTYYYFRQNGRYAMDVRALETTMEGSVRMVTLEVKSPPRKQQRREAFRLEAALRVIVRREREGPFPLRYEEEDLNLEEETRTMDIGEAGLSFKTRNIFDLGERLYIKVYLGWPTEREPPLELIGEVRRRHTLDVATYEKQVGVKFHKLDDETRRTIARYVLVKQQTMLRQQRLPRPQ